MATRDRNGALHSEKNGQFVSGGDSGSSGFDVEALEKQPRGHDATIRPGEGEPPDEARSLALEYKLPGIKLTVNPGKYSKESKAYENRIRAELRIPNVEISKIDKVCAYDVYSSLKSCIASFPSMKGFIKGVRYDPDVNELAQWHPFAKEIILGRAYSDAGIVEKTYNDCVADKFFASGITHRAVVAHEFGHAINTRFSSRSYDFAESVKTEIYHHFGIDDEYVRKNICEYATLNSAEFVAVLFHRCAEQTNTSDDIMEKFKSILRRYK